MSAQLEVGKRYRASHWRKGAAIEVIAIGDRQVFGRTNLGSEGTWAVGEPWEPAIEPLQWLEGADVRVDADGRHTFGVEDMALFPVGSWQRIYVPADRLDEVREALDQIGAP